MLPKVMHCIGYQLFIIAEADFVEVLKWLNVYVLADYLLP